MFFSRQFPGERRPRFTVIPDKSVPLPNGTLVANLGPKRTGIGRAGLDALLDAE